MLVFLSGIENTVVHVLYISTSSIFFVVFPHTLEAFTQNSKEPLRSEKFHDAQSLQKNRAL